MNKALRKYKIHHLVFWLLLFGAWHFFRYQDYPKNTAIWISLLKVADLALLVYITNYILIPRLLYKKRYWIFGISFIGMIVVSSLIKLYLLGRLMNNPGAFAFSANIKARIYDNVLPHILLVCTGAAFKLMNDQIRSQKQMTELVREKSNAELNFLKSQINPHFIFNSLNSVYFLIDKGNEEARQTLLQFSDLLRYQLYDCNADNVPIEKETAFILDYVRLQKLRKDQQYDIQYSLPRDISGFSIAPLLLIPFIENAFKHISHYSNGKNYIHIAFEKKGDRFIMIVKNSKDNSTRSTEPKGGIGLNNVKRRLELLYPTKHLLNIRESDQQFAVQLELIVSDMA